MRFLVLPLGAAVLSFLPLSADATTPGEIPTAFAIAKSSNKNQVHYAVDVTDACAPANSAPVHPYWRMLERGPEATEALTSSEQRAFGLADQEVAGDSVRVVLRGFKGKPITIHTAKTEGGCAASALTSIEGTEARISNIYVKVGLFGVSYVQLTGVASNGSVVTERVSP